MVVATPSKEKDHERPLSQEGPQGPQALIHMPDIQPAQQRPATGQPPFGSSPATGPTQNQGYSAQGLAALAMIVEQLGKIIPLVGAGSEVGQDVLDALRKLSKHVPPGSVSPASQNNQLQQLMLARARMQGMPQQGGMARPAAPQQAMPAAA